MQILSVSASMPVSLSFCLSVFHFSFLLKLVDGFEGRKGVGAADQLITVLLVLMTGFL
jgi:hypothetical protein